MVKIRTTLIFAILLNVIDLGANLNVFSYYAVMFLLFNSTKSWKLKFLQPLCIAILIICCKNSPPPAQTPILMILRVHTISSIFVWNAANWQTTDFTDDFYLFFSLCRALETGFNLHFCLKFSESNCSSLSCLKTPNNVKNGFIPYPLFTHLMKRASLGQLALKGGTTLNQLPIGLHIKILSFNGRFEAYWAKCGMLSWYQSIQNRWKFNICFNVWVVVGIVFAVRARKQRPPCFWPDFKHQNAIPPPSHHTDYFRHWKQYFIFWRF